MHTEERKTKRKTACKYPHHPPLDLSLTSLCDISVLQQVTTAVKTIRSVMENDRVKGVYPKAWSATIMIALQRKVNLELEVPLLL